MSTVTQRKLNVQFQTMHTEQRKIQHLRKMAQATKCSNLMSPFPFK